MMVWSQIRRRGGRSVALLLAILIAAGGFTVLTASSAASRLQTVGTVNAHALPAYDVLVRPKGARSALEKSQGLVQPGFLTGIYGGITLDQWAKIKALPGIDVAAPVAMVGYVVPLVYLPINMRPALPTSGDGVARMDVTWSFDNGLSREQQSPDFAYLTTDSLPINGGLVSAGEGYFLQKGSGAGAPAICPPHARAPDRHAEHPSLDDQLLLPDQGRSLHVWIGGSRGVLPASGGRGRGGPGRGEQA